MPPSQGTFKRVLRGKLYKAHYVGRIISPWPKITSCKLPMPCPFNTEMQCVGRCLLSCIVLFKKVITISLWFSWLRKCYVVVLPAKFILLLFSVLWRLLGLLFSRLSVLKNKFQHPSVSWNKMTFQVFCGTFCNIPCKYRSLADKGHYSLVLSSIE